MEENQDGIGGNGEGEVVDEVFEKAEQEVMYFLPEMSVQELSNLCAELGLIIPVAARVSRKLLYRFIISYLLKLEEEEGDGGKAKYLQIHGFLRQLVDNREPPVAVEVKEPAAVVEAPVPEINADLLNLNAINHGLLDLNPTPPALTRRVLPGAPGEGGLMVGAKPKDEIKSSTPMAMHYAPSANLVPLKSSRRSGSLYQLKECKIRGSIGDPGEKDKVSYYGLLSQIVEKQSEGYDENRIVGAVINAITPGNVFKSRLEMRRTLEGHISLATLQGMLRTHFQESSSNDIFNDLSRAVQGHDENATSYCNRLIVIRDKALSRSIEEGCRIEAAYLRKRFLTSFATGLRNGNIRNELREILKSEPDDDTLLECIANAVRAEKERADKFAQLKNSNVGAEVSVVQREKEDFQLKRGNEVVAKMKDMRRCHEQ